MSFDTLIDNEAIRSEYLAVLTPKRKVRFSELTYTGTSGTGLGGAFKVYSLSFTYGDVISVDRLTPSIDITTNPVTLMTTLSSINDTFQAYFDFELKILYIAMESLDVESDHYIEYNLYLSTRPGYWYLDPLDSSTREVFYDAIIDQTPTFKSSTEDTIFGFTPTESSTLTLLNQDGVLNEHLYSSSFNKVPLVIYQYLGPISVGGMKLIRRAVCGNYTWTFDKVTFTVFSAQELFNQTYSPPHGYDQYYLSGLNGVSHSRYAPFNAYADLDPKFYGKPARAIYGRAKGVQLVCISQATLFDGASKTARAWYVKNGASGEHEIDQVVTVHNSSTVSTVADASLFRVGDEIWLDALAGSGSDQWIQVTAVDFVLNKVTFTGVSGSGPVVGDRLRRTYISTINIYDTGTDITYPAKYGRDFFPKFTVTLGVTDVDYPQTIKFTDTVESNLSLPRDLDTDYILYADVLGDFAGSDSPLVDSVLDILTTNCRIDSGDIDTGSFTDAGALVTDTIGYAIPRTFSESLVNISDVLSTLLQTGLLKLYINSDGKWAVSRIAPLVSADETIESEDIFGDGLRFQVNYDEIISQVVIKFRAQEFDLTEKIINVNYLSSSVRNFDAEFLYGVVKQKEFTTLHTVYDEALTWAKRVSFILSERRGQMDAFVGRRFLNTEINDSVEIETERLPGFSLTTGVRNSRSFQVQGFDKGKDTVTLNLEDAKGLTDHSSEWDSPDLTGDDITDYRNGAGF